VARNGIFYVARRTDLPVDDVVLAFLRVITIKSAEELQKWIDVVSFLRIGFSRNFRNKTKFGLRPLHVQGYAGHPV
jgi:hypothetical protein